MKILLTDLAYFHHNYGAQGIILPFLEKLRKHVDADFGVTISEIKYLEEDKKFALENNFKIFHKPRIKFSTFISPKGIRKHREYRNLIKEYDVIIDLSGIEFIGNLPFISRWKDLINIFYTQNLARKYSKKYYKFTKSYGPFPNFFYSKIISQQLNKLPFLQVRGEDNLEVIDKLNLKIPLHSFPDISLTLKPADRNWAENYLSKIFKNVPQQILGISPSVVIRNIRNIPNKTSGENHVELCKQIIMKYCQMGKTVLLIPHSIGDGKSLSSCDLALSKKIFEELNNVENLFILDDINLSYKQVRAIIGLLDFYVTSRYHSVASALNMNIPIVSLSWHIKYKDIMNLYLDDFLAVNCREKTISESLEQINKFYENRNWYDKNKMQKRQLEIEKKIDESMMMIVDDIKR